MARRAQTEAFHFEGFEYPTTTPVPDVIFDAFLSRLGEAELKALLYIVRRTFGFKKDRDAISFNQFLRGIKTREGQVLDEGCGVKDRTTLSRALQSLEAMGIIRSEKGIDARGENETTVYSLRFKGDAPPAVATPAPAPEVVGNSYHPAGNHREARVGVVGNSYQGGREPLPGVVGIPHYRGRENPPGVVGNAYPQETELQETEGQDHSNIRKDAPNFFLVDNSVDNSVDTGAMDDVLPPDGPLAAANHRFLAETSPVHPAEAHAFPIAPPAVDNPVDNSVDNPEARDEFPLAGLPDDARSVAVPVIETIAGRLPEATPPSRAQMPVSPFPGAGSDRDDPVPSVPPADPARGPARTVPAPFEAAARPAAPSALPSPRGRKRLPPPGLADGAREPPAQARTFPLALGPPEASRGDHVIADAPYDGSRELLARFVEDFAREFNDQAPLRSTLSRLVNLYGRSGLPMEAFVAHLYAARQTTQERTGAIRTRAGEGVAKNKMVYFFGVLENRLGFRDHLESSDLAAMLGRSGA